MGYTAYLQALLKPLGVYALQPESRSGGELFALGQSFDALQQTVQDALAEALPATATAQTLRSFCQLFGLVPDTQSVQELRDMVLSLLRIGKDGATVQALTDTLSACGVPAVVRETQSENTLCVYFPTLDSEPENFPVLQARIEAILPCHMAITYAYHSISWLSIQDAGWLWSDFCAESWKLLLASTPS